MTEPSAPIHPQLRCTHLHPSGHHCGSFALRGEPFCYHHHPSRPPARHARYASGKAPFDLPMPTSRESLQIALTEVALRIADNTLDTKRAGLIIQCLQTTAATYTD